MSAYICNNETFDNLAATMYHFANYGHYYYIKQSLAGLPLKHESMKRATKRLAYRLYSLNIGGIICRYGKQDVKAFAGEWYKHTSKTPLHINQFYKSLKCLLYQCSEGKNIEKPLFKRLENVLTATAHEIANHATENCKWS